MWRALGRTIGSDARSVARAVSHRPETETAPAFLHCRIFGRKTGFHPRLRRGRHFPENALNPTYAPNPPFRNCMEIWPIGLRKNGGSLKIQARYREPWLWSVPEPCGRRVGRLRIIVNNNESRPITNNRGYDRPPTKTPGSDAYRRAQFVSFNFTNALICTLASRARFQLVPRPALVRRL